MVGAPASSDQRARRAVPPPPPPAGENCWGGLPVSCRLASQWAVGWVGMQGAPQPRPRRTQPEQGCGWPLGARGGKTRTPRKAAARAAHHRARPARRLLRPSPLQERCRSCSTPSTAGRVAMAQEHEMKRGPFIYSSGHRHRRHAT